MKVINIISVAIIGFQLSWCLISVASELIASASSHVDEPTGKTMDNNISSLLTSNTLSRKELLFSSRVIYSQPSPTRSHRVLGKTSACVRFLFASETNGLTNLPSTTDTENLVVSSTTRSHMFSSRERSDITGQSKPSKQPEIRNTPLVISQNGIYKTATSFLSTHNSENKVFTTLQEQVASSVKLEQTSVKYPDVLNSPSIIEKRTPNLSGKYSSEMILMGSTTQVNELSSLNIALSTQIFSKHQTATNVQIATTKKVAIFSKVVSASSIASIDENNSMEHSRESPAVASNSNPIKVEMKTSISGSKTAHDLVPGSSHKLVITTTSVEKLKIFDTASLIHGSLAGSKSGVLMNLPSTFVNISSSAPLEKSAIKSIGTTTQITDTSHPTKYSLVKILSTTDGKEFPSSIEPSKVAYSVETLNRHTDVPRLSRDMSEITTSSVSGLSSTEFSILGMRSSVRPSPSTTETNPQIFPSPSNSITRRNLNSLPSFLSRSAPLSALSYTTSLPINSIHSHPPQEFNTTKIILPGMAASGSVAESDNSAVEILDSQTVAIVTVKTEGKTTVVSNITKPGGILTTTGILKDTSNATGYKTLGSKYANALTSSSIGEGSSIYKVQTLSEPQSKVLYQKTKSLITAQEPSTTTVFTGKYTTRSLHDRNTASKVLPMAMSTVMQVIPATHHTANSLVSVWSVETRMVQTPGVTRVKSSSPYGDASTKSGRTTNTGFDKMRTTTAFAGRGSTQFSSPLTTVTADQTPGVTRGDASGTSTDIPLVNAAQQTSRLPMLLAIALIPSIVLIILLFAFVIWRHRRKNSGGPVYNITVEYADETRPPLAHQNSWIDLTIKGIHIDLEFPNSEKRKSAHVSTATQMNFSSGLQMRELQLPKLKQKEYSLKWLNGIIKRQLELPHPDSDERSSTSTRRPVSVYSAKEKENYEPSEKMTRHESLKCTREAPRYEALRCIRKAPRLDEFERTNEGFDMSTKERKKRTKRKSLASEDDSFVCTCAENKNEDQNDNNLKQESKQLDIVKLPEAAIPMVKLSQADNISAKPNAVDSAKRYDVKHEEDDKDESLLPIPGRRRLLMLRSRFETL